MGEAIKQLEECLEKSMRNGTYWVGNKDFSIPCYAMLCILRRLTQRIPKWISVEDRLSENCAEVLLYYKKGYLSMGYWDDDLCEWDGMPDEKIVRPDYWMPLPEAPKEGE